jgi:hypothetical protein
MFQSLRFISLGLIGAAIAAFGQSAMPTAQMPVSTTVQLLELKLLVDPTMPLYSRYTVERPDVPETSPLFKSLGWEVLLNGRSERSASARSSTQERLSTTRTGKYTVFLSAAGQDQYERVSNIIEVVVDLEAKGKPAIPAGAIVTKTKAGATSTYAVLDAKDLLKLELKKTGNQYLVRRP